jgi:ABC-2 type transport system ATP-binding protein
MDEAETLCQRVAIMDHGSILRIGPPAELIRSAGQDVRIAAESGQLSLGDARALVAAADPDGRADDDGVTLSITTTQPALVLTALAAGGRWPG